MSEKLSLPEASVRKYARLFVLCLAAFAALNALVIWKFRDSVAEGYGDFTSFYAGARIVAAGQGSRLYDPKLQWQVQQQFAPEVKIRRGPLPFVRPPFEALLFLPLGYLPYRVAFGLWLVCKIALLVGVCLLLPPIQKEDRFVGSWQVRALMCFAFFPVGFDLMQGQDAILVLLILTLSLRFLFKGSELAAGAVLGLGLIKFHLILPLFLIVAWKRGSRFMLGFAGTASALFLISLAMVHWSGILAYPGYLLSLTPDLGVVRTQSMPNLRGLLAALTALRAAPGAVQAALWLLELAGVGLAVFLWRRQGGAGTLRGFSLAIVVLLLSSYYANSYDLTLLLIPLLVFGEAIWKTEISGWGKTWFLISSAVLLCTPLLWLMIVKVDGACWLALDLVVFGISAAAIERATLSAPILDRG